MYAAQWNVYVVLFKKIYFKNLYIFLRLFKACLYEFSSCDLKISIIGIYFKYTWHCAVQCLWSCGNMTRKLEDFERGPSKHKESIYISHQTQYLTAVRQHC